MSETMESVERRLADRVRGLRQASGFTLDDLARQSGVSRAAISLIERGESSPTANVLDRLAAGLGVTLAALFAERERPDASPLNRRTDQSAWTDPETGYVRRNLSPQGFPSRLELVEVTLPPETRVSYDAGSRLSVVEQQVWVLSGALQIRVGATLHALAAGDCLAMQLDQPVGFHNPTARPTRYLVALTSSMTRKGNSL